MGRFNPWAVSASPEPVQPEYPDRLTSRYAAPTGDSGYSNGDGWSPSPRRELGNTPDPARLGVQALRQTVPAPEQAPETFYRPLDEDKDRRAAVESVTATGWVEDKRAPGYPSPDGGRFAPNPRSIPPRETRVTEEMVPRSYSFMRPFGWGMPKIGARALSGIHFSMADHKRTYEILGMQPVRSARNTYRMDPQPWDASIVDMPAEPSGYPSAKIVAADIPYPITRSYRLS